MTPWTVAHQAPLSIEFPRQEYLSGLPFPCAKYPGSKDVPLGWPWEAQSSPWQEYREELYKKDLHDPDNHDGVITDLEPHILECEVKWALESITILRAVTATVTRVRLYFSLLVISVSCV